MAFAGCPRNPTLGNGSIDSRIIEVQVRDEDVQQGLGAVHSVFEVLNVLWCRVSSPVRRLVVSAFCYNF